MTGSWRIFACMLIGFTAATVASVLLPAGGSPLASALLGILGLVVGMVVGVVWEWWPERGELRDWWRGEGDR